MVRHFVKIMGFHSCGLSICEGCQKNILTKLLCTLIAMTRAREDERECDEVSIEVSRCLGLIGPVDTGFVVLRSLYVDNDLELAMLSMREDEQLNRYCQIFHSLNNYLVDVE